jgi:hypothetical protein
LPLGVCGGVSLELKLRTLNNARPKARAINPAFPDPENHRIEDRYSTLLKEGEFIPRRTDFYRGFNFLSLSFVFFGSFSCS